MSCSTYENDLALLVSDDLAPGAAARLHRHIRGCSDCRAQLQQYRADAGWLRQQRSARVDATLTAQLRVRIAADIASKPPASWSVAWLQRFFASATRGPQPLLAATAATLLLVGALGALRRPLDGGAAVAEGIGIGTSGGVNPAERAAQRHGHQHNESAWADEAGSDLAAPAGLATAGQDDASEPTLAAVGETEAAEAELVAPQERLPDETGELPDTTPGAMRIELETKDPDVRIIWFAQADRAGDGHDGDPRTR